MNSEESKKRGDKASEPTRQELEFLGALFLRGLTTSEIQEEIQSSELPSRTKSFIKRRRKEFESYRKVIEEKAKVVFDPVVIQRRKEHWDELADMAAQLFNYWDRYLNHEKIDNRGYIVSDEELEQIDWLTAELLLSHLKEEFSEEFATVNDWTNLIQKDYAEICVHRLGLLAKRKTFKGTCTVCQEWSFK